MAEEQLLSINEDSLTDIATAIRTKGSINSNTKLLFPGDANTPNSFIGALKDIITIETVTPKITAQQKILTPSDTTFSITPGFHDGNGTVKIQFDTINNSGTPGSSLQTITPATGKFFNSFNVKGVGSSGIRVETGTFTANSTSVTISGLGNFTPQGIAGFLISHDNNTTTHTVVFQGIFTNDTTYYANEITYSSYKVLSNGSVGSEDQFKFLNGSVEINLGLSTNKFIGTYFYVVWGN